MFPGAVLFSEMTPEPEWADAFHDWYDQEHIPLRMRVPGFLGAQRYKRTDRDGYLAVYDMETPNVLASAAYGEVKNNPSPLTARMLRDVQGFTRYTGVLAGSGLREGTTPSEALESAILYAVFFEVPDTRAADFEEWYQEDHVPILLECPDWLACRRYRIVSGEPGGWTHLAIHHLATVDALDSDARARARATPWRARLAAEPWFKGTYHVFERMGPRFQPVAG